MLAQNNIMIYGQSGSGKSTLMLKILRKIHNKFDFIYAFGEYSHEFKNVLGNQFVFDGINDNVLRGITQYQRNNRNKRIFLIFDDVLCENLHHNSFLRAFFSICRHEHITCAFITQVVNGIPPALRKNIRHLFAKTVDNELMMYIHVRSMYSIKEIKHLINTNSNKTFFYFKFKNIQD